MVMEAASHSGAYGGTYYTEFGFVFDAHVLPNTTLIIENIIIPYNIGFRIN